MEDTGTVDRSDYAVGGPAALAASAEGQQLPTGDEMATEYLRRYRKPRRSATADTRTVATQRTQ